MALSLGTLRGYIGIDSSGVDEGLNEAGDKIKRFGGAGAALAKTAGAAAGAGIVAGLVANMDISAANSKLQAQLGLTTDEAGKAGSLAATIYRDNFGEDLGQVNEAVRAVVQNIGTDLNDADFTGITEKVISLSDTFEQDFGATSAAVGQLLKTGLAKDADEALDIVASGFQNGADKSGDFLDTLNEYGVQFQKLGLNGQTATNLISQGLQAGARDGDLVADAFKEFSIRAIDGSDTTAAAFQGLGLDAQALSAAIAAGGPAAEAGLDQVLDKLRAVKDPAQQAQLATSLFGTQAEDLGKALFALDPSSAVAGVDEFAGAAQGVVDVTGSGPQAKMETWRRKLIGMGQDAIASAGPLGAVATAVALAGPAALSVLGPMASLLAARSAARAAAIAAAAAEGTADAVTQRGIVSRVAHTAVTVAGTVATGVMTAAQWALNLAMSANPIALVVIALVALAAGFVVAYEKVGWFHDAVNAVFSWLREHWPLVLGILLGPIGLAVVAIATHWDTIVNTVTGIPARIAGAAAGMWDGISNAFVSMINVVIRAWNALDFRVPGFSAFGVDVGGFDVGLPDLKEIGKGGDPKTQARSGPGSGPDGAYFFAEGGIVAHSPGGTHAVIGEAGEDEVVSPLSKLTGMIAEAVAGAAGGDTFIVQGDVTDARRMLTEAELKRRQRRVTNGLRFRGVAA